MTNGEAPEGAERAKIRAWHPGMTDAETKDLAYWERNVLALHFADGWYNDDLPINWAADAHVNTGVYALAEKRPRYQGWRRVLSLDYGAITFHIPDDFDVGDLPQIEPNWDGHTTEEKWRRVLAKRGVRVEP